MSVAVLKLEDKSLVAFNLNNVTKMYLAKEGLYFECINGTSYRTYVDVGTTRILKLDPSTKGSTPSGDYKPYSAEHMFEKFCNL
jgi:hypothetical protein